MVSHSAAGCIDDVPYARDALAAIADRDLRELARDFFLNQRFRRDVFVRGARPLDEEERRRSLTDTLFDLQRPADLVEYATDLQAGRLNFDNDFTRTIVAALHDGPRRLTDIPGDEGLRAHLLGNALTRAPPIRFVRLALSRPTSKG